MQLGNGIAVIFVFDKAVEACGAFVCGCGGVVVAGSIGGGGAEVGCGGVAADYR